MKKMYKDYLSKVEKINEDFKNYQMSMTPFEVQKFYQEKKDMVESYGLVIEKGILEEVYNAYENFNSEKARLEELKKRELNSWDADKLNANFGVTRVLFDMAVSSDNVASKDRTVDKLQRLMSEAIDSGDKYKLRAFNELLPGIQATMPDRGEAMKVNSLMHESAKKLEEIRETPEIVAQYQKIREAYDNFIHVELSAKVAVDTMGASQPGQLKEMLRKVDKYMDNGMPNVEIMQSESEKRRYIMQ
jgi:hypothetical protein